jgi:type I restriction enzyme, S subunit
MSEWPSVRLDRCCDIQMGQAPPGTSYNSEGHGVPLIAGAGDFASSGPAPKKFTTSPTKLCRAGDIVVGIRATIGVKVWADDEYCLGRGVAGIRPKDPMALDSRFLWHWLSHAKGELARKGKGATFLQVNRTDISEMLIPVPPLGEQRRIAGILDAADALRAKRRETLALIDTLTQSIFLDMFGDKTRWSLRDIGSLGVVTTGRTPPTSEGMFGGTIPFVTPGDLASAKPVVRTLTEAGASASRTVASGATLVCCIGATIGKVGSAVELSAFNQQLNAIEWGSEVLPQYGLFALKRLRPEIVGRGSSTTLPLLPKGQFMRLKIPVPPLELQGEFEVCVNRIDLQSAETRIALERHDLLFASLQARAFRGQL